MYGIDAEDIYIDCYSYSWRATRSLGGLTGHPSSDYSAEGAGQITVYRVSPGELNSAYGGGGIHCAIHIESGTVQPFQGKGSTLCKGTIQLLQGNGSTFAR